jgi:hypothetical protein
MRLDVGLLGGSEGPQSGPRNPGECFGSSLVSSSMSKRISYWFLVGMQCLFLPVEDEDGTS